MAKLKIFEFCKQLNTRHIFWSCSIRGVNMKFGSGEYCRSYRADTILSTDGQRDGQGETSVPRFNFVEWGYNKTTTATQYHFQPADYLPLHHGLKFIKPTPLYIRACCIIYINNLYYSVNKSTTMNNPNLCSTGFKFFQLKKWFHIIHCSAGEKRRTHQTFLLARPKCLMGDFTNLYRIQCISSPTDKCLINHENLWPTLFIGP